VANNNSYGNIKGTALQKVNYHPINFDAHSDFRIRGKTQRNGFSYALKKVS
jgi:arginase family enzyme